MSSDEELVFKKKGSKKGSGSSSSAKAKSSIQSFDDDIPVSTFLHHSIGANKTSSEMQRSQLKELLLAEESTDLSSNFLPVSRNTSMYDTDDTILFKKATPGMERYGLNVANEMPAEIPICVETVDIPNVNELQTRGVVETSTQFTPIIIDDDDDDLVVEQHIPAQLIEEEEDHGLFAQMQSIDSFIPVSKAIVVESKQITLDSILQKPRKHGKTDFLVDILSLQVRNLQIQEEELTERCIHIAADIQVFQGAQEEEKKTLETSQLELSALQAEDQYFNGLTSCYIVKNAVLQGLVDKYIDILRQIDAIQNAAFLTDIDRLVNQSVGVAQDVYGRSSTVLGGMQGLESASLRKQMKQKASWPRRSRNVYSDSGFIDGEETEEEDAALDPEDVSRMDKLVRDKDLVLRSVSSLHSDVDSEYSTLEAIEQRVLSSDVLRVEEQAAVQGLFILQKVVLEDPLAFQVLQRYSEPLQDYITTLYLAPYAKKWYSAQTPRRTQQYPQTREIEETSSDKKKRSYTGSMMFVKGDNLSVQSGDGWKHVWEEYLGLNSVRNRDIAWFGCKLFPLVRSHAGIASVLQDRLEHLLSGLPVPVYTNLDIRSVRFGLNVSLRVLKLLRVSATYEITLPEELVMKYIRGILLFTKQQSAYLEDSTAFEVNTEDAAKPSISLSFFITLITSCILTTLHTTCTGVEYLSRIQACTKQCARSQLEVPYKSFAAFVLDYVMDIKDSQVIQKVESVHECISALQGYTATYETGRKACLFALQLLLNQ